MFLLQHKRDECIGCGLCAEVAPHYFRMERDGLAGLVPPDCLRHPFNSCSAFEEDLPELRQAMDHCPVGIIVLLAARRGKAPRLLM